MKFGENLKSNLTSEWKSQYVDYEGLKDIITRFELGQKGANATLMHAVVKMQSSEYFMEMQFNNCSEEFFIKIHENLEKINLFFAEKMSYCSRKYQEIDQAWTLIKENLSTHHKEARNMKHAIAEFYLMVKKVEEYQELNYTGLRKICKKHDKLLKRATGKEFMAVVVAKAPFRTNKQIVRIVRDLEQTMTSLEGGDSKAAMSRLRVPPMQDKADDRTTPLLVSCGILIGTTSIMLLLNVGVIIYGNIEIDVDNTIILFRPTFFIWFFLVLFSINIYGWQRNGINSVLIFELNPRDRLTHWHMASIAWTLAFIWSVSLFLFLFLSSEFVQLGPLPVFLIPVCLNTLHLLLLLLPTNLLSLNSTRAWLKRVFKIELLAGFVPVAFVDFWLADQFNSLSVVFLDIEYFICYFASHQTLYTVTENIGTNSTVTNDPSQIDNSSTLDLTCGKYGYIVRYFVAIYPAYIRFAQCIRRWQDSPKNRKAHHLHNAAKYSTTFIKVGMSAIYQYYMHTAVFVFWILTHTVSSIFTLYWDLINDWGLLHWDSSNKLLRDELVYSYGDRHGLYFAAMVGDCILRFTWVPHYFVMTYTNFPKTVSTSIFAVLEVLRRFVWNFFRLENEHLNNCGEFRAVRDISMAPLREDDFSKLMKLMDMDDTTDINRRKMKRA